MKKIAVILLFLAVILIYFQHRHYFTELYYDRDVALYAFDAASVLAGKGWYYCHNIKPPGITSIFLLAFVLFGASFKSIYLIALVFNILTVYLLYLFAKIFFSKTIKFYFFLPILFILIFSSEELKTYAANTEVFLVTFEIAGMLFLCLRKYFISGLLLGLGFLIRQTGVFTFAAGLIFITALKFQEKTSFRELIKELEVYFLGFIVPAMLFSVYFFYKGVFNKFIDYAFIYNLRNIGEYVGDIRKNDLFFTKKIFWDTQSFKIIIFAFFSLIGLFYTALTRRAKPNLLASIWFIVICLGLSITAVYPHHFIQLIIPTACVSLLGISAVFERIELLFKNKASLRNGCFMTLMAVILIFYIRSVATFNTKKRPICFSFAAEDRFFAAKYIKEHSFIEDKIFVWDNSDLAAIFFWSGRQRVCSFDTRNVMLPPETREYWTPLINRDYRSYQEELVSVFKKDPPKFTILVSDYRAIVSKSGALIAEIKDFALEKKAFPEFFQILDKDYFLEKVIGQCLIYRIKS